MPIDRSRSRTSVQASPGGGAYQNGAAVAANSVRGQASTSQWTPTVARLFVLLILEIAAFAALRYAFGVAAKSI
jgi:hypothetical protein